MDVGVGLFNRKLHLPRGYSGQIRYTAGNPQEVVFYQLDRETYISLLWAKFNNGRFFANGEYAIADSDSAVSNVAVNTFTALTPRNETLTYHAFAELGMFAGPAKFTFMAAQSSGNVWSNYGWQLGNAGAGGTGGVSITSLGPVFGGSSNFPVSPWVTRSYGILPINYQVLEPYNYLMFNTYGGGNNIFNADGTGEMGDARALALRVDYAVAANLNVYGTFMYAKRLERHGYFAGQFGTFDTVLRQGSDGNFNAGLARIWKGNVGLSNANPWIDDDLIGWEADGGVTWQLLEGLTTDVRYAYWQPGQWFDMAYKTFNGGHVEGETLVYGSDFMRGRSAIQAVHVSLKVNF